MKTAYLVTFSQCVRIIAESEDEAVENGFIKAHETMMFNGPNDSLNDIKPDQECPYGTFDKDEKHPLCDAVLTKEELIQSLSASPAVETIKLYYHKTDGGAEYLTDKYIKWSHNGKSGKEGIFEGAKYIVRIDGDITKDAELIVKTQ